MSESPSRESRHKRKRTIPSGSEGGGHDRDNGQLGMTARERRRRSQSVSPSRYSESFKSMSEEREEGRGLTLRPKSDEAIERDVKSDTSGSPEKKRSGSTHSYSTGLPKRKDGEYRRNGESEKPEVLNRGRGKDRRGLNQPTPYWGSMNPSPLGIAWGTSSEARRRLRENRSSQSDGGGGDDGHWDNFQRDWQTHTVEHLMTSRGGKSREGVRRKVTSLPSRYRSKSRR